MVLEAIRYQPARGLAGPTLEIIDQLLLPHRTAFFSIRTCEDAHAAIKEMRVRGAPAIAIVAALALAVELSSSQIQGKSESASSIVDTVGQRLDFLMSSRPTAVNLGDAVRKLKVVVKKAAAIGNADGEMVIERYTKAAEKMLTDDVADNEAIGQYGAQWIAENTIAGARKRMEKTAELKVLTHCNTGSLATAGYGTALGVIRSLRSSGLLTSAFCTETRPYNQGSRLTAYELVHDNIPASLITDSMAGALMAKEGNALAAVVVGADRVAANGDTANKIGTYALAVLAKHHGVKFLVAAPRTSIDLYTPSGQEIQIEQRPPHEVVQLKGPRIADSGEVMTDSEPARISIAASGIQVWNPSFDVTPSTLIDGVITEVGVVERNANERFDFGPIFAEPHENGSQG